MSNDPTFFYFAYGSNMLSRRMHERTPSARRIGLATLPGYALRWHKVSKDGSGKCNIVPEPGGVVRGVVYEIAAQERGALDAAEGLGLGHSEVSLEVQMADGPHKVISYQATNIDSFTKPYSWYKALVVAGAKEQQLDPAYVQALDLAPAWEDPDPQRAADNLRQLSSC